MGLYDIKFHDTNVKVRVADDQSVLEKEIYELVSQISDHSGLVAVDLKGFHESNDGQSSAGPKLLLLYAKDRCLIAHVNTSLSLYCVRSQILSKEKFFFVGTEIDSKVLSMDKYYKATFNFRARDPFMKMRAEIGEFAARACKKPELRKFGGLRDLGNRVGIDFPKEVTYKLGAKWPPQDATIFTDEEVKYAIRDVYMCYHIAEKCLSVLPE